MVTLKHSRNLELTFLVVGTVLLASMPALAQQGSVLTTLENSVVTAARGWETTVMNAARSLFWILAGIEVGIAAVWLAINAASLDSWFAELVRRIMFIGLFAFILDQGPGFAKAVVDSLFQLGGDGGSASPANIFDAGIRVASKMSEQARFGLFEDNALAIASVFAMVVVVVSFSLVAAIFVAVMVEMYVGLLAGMIMLGLGGSSFTKDFAVRYLVYAFSVGMKLMALVMIARIGSDVLLGLAEAPTATSDQFITTLAIAGFPLLFSLSPCMCRQSCKVWCREPRSPEAWRQSATERKLRHSLLAAPFSEPVRSPRELPPQARPARAVHPLREPPYAVWHRPSVTPAGPPVPPRKKRRSPHQVPMRDHS